MSLKIRGKGNYKYDISLPVEKMYEIVEIFKQKLKGSAFTAIVGYGHMGDGIILHLFLNFLYLFSIFWLIFFFFHIF